MRVREGNSGPALIVAENQMVVCYLQGALRERFQSVRAVKSARQAISLLDSRPFGAVFINEYLPDMGPVDLVCRIKAGWPGAKVIMITSDQAGAGNLCLKYGADSVIRKPFRLDEVLRSLEAPARKTAVKKVSVPAMPHSGNHKKHLFVFLRTAR